MARACSMPRRSNFNAVPPGQRLSFAARRARAPSPTDHANLAEHLRCTPEEVGAELIAVDRGGDITYHGPGQLTGYPILSLAAGAGPLRHVLSVEEVLINALRDLARDPVASQLRVYGSMLHRRIRKNCGHWHRALVSERCTALLSMSPPTWPTCVNTSLRAVFLMPVTRSPRRGSRCRCQMSWQRFCAAERSGEAGGVDRQDVQWRTSVTDLSLFSQGAGPGEPVRLRSRARSAGLDDGLPLEERKPDWLQPVVHHGSEVLATRKVPITTWSPYAKTQVAQISPNAGLTERRHSWCSEIVAPGPAGSVSSTPRNPMASMR